MKSKEMRAVLDRWKESGQSLRAFGVREGHSYSKLLYWRRRLEPREPKPEKIDFAPVQVVQAPETVPVKSDTIGIWLPNGVSLDVPAGVASEDVLRLVESLSRC